MLVPFFRKYELYFVTTLVVRCSIINCDIIMCTHRTKQEIWISNLHCPYRKRTLRWEKTRGSRCKFELSVCYSLLLQCQGRKMEWCCRRGEVVPRAWFHRGMTATWGPARRCGRWRRAASPSPAATWPSSPAGAAPASRAARRWWLRNARGAG